jgi:hypothetical protein
MQRTWANLEFLVEQTMDIFIQSIIIEGTFVDLSENQ